MMHWLQDNEPADPTPELRAALDRLEEVAAGVRARYA